ncbi:MAG: hypothetical protein WKF96_20390 [Solirubrobacteraceae bacterium]
MATPIHLCSGDGLTEVAYEDAPPVALTRRMLVDPAAALDVLLEPD